MGTPTPVVATLFSDPMMGLAYECEPTLDKLATRYGEAFHLRHAMVVLVRDVSDFMTAEERALPAARGIATYNKRLAQIYLDEEHLGGLPMCMEGFHLFDEEHRSSEPLCLAFEAARIASPHKAETFLRALRRATIVEGRQTTRTDFLREIASEVGVDCAPFDRALNSGAARRALAADESLASRVGVRGLPALLMQGCSKSVLTSPLVGSDRLASLMDELMKP